MGPLGGRPIYRSADLPMGPTASSLRCGNSSLDGEVGSRGYLLIPRPRRGWLPTIYMRRGAPFQSSQHQHNIHPSKRDVVSLSCRGLRTRGVRVRVVVRGLRVFMEGPVCVLLSLYVIL